MYSIDCHHDYQFERVSRVVGTQPSPTSTAQQSTGGAVTTPQQHPPSAAVVSSSDMNHPNGQMFGSNPVSQSATLQNSVIQQTMPQSRSGVIQPGTGGGGQGFNPHPYQNFPAAAMALGYNNYASNLIQMQMAAGFLANPSASHPGGSSGFNPGATSQQLGQGGGFSHFPYHPLVNHSAAYMAANQIRQPIAQQAVNQSSTTSRLYANNTSSTAAGIGRPVVTSSFPSLYEESAPRDSQASSLPTTAAHYNQAALQQHQMQMLKQLHLARNQQQQQLPTTSGQTDHFDGHVQVGSDSRLSAFQQQQTQQQQAVFVQQEQERINREQQERAQAFSMVQQHQALQQQQQQHIQAPSQQQQQQMLFNSSPSVSSSSHQQNMQQVSIQPIVKQEDPSPIIDPHPPPNDVKPPVVIEQSLKRESSVPPNVDITSPRGVSVSGSVGIQRSPGQPATTATVVNKTVPTAQKMECDSSVPSPPTQNKQALEVADRNLNHELTLLAQRCTAGQRDSPDDVFDLPAASSPVLKIGLRSPSSYPATSSTVVINKTTTTDTGLSLMAKRSESPLTCITSPVAGSSSVKSESGSARSSRPTFTPSQSCNNRISSPKKKPKMNELARLLDDLTAYGPKGERLKSSGASEEDSSVGSADEHSDAESGNKVSSSSKPTVLSREKSKSVPNHVKSPVGRGVKSGTGASSNSKKAATGDDSSRDSSRESSSRESSVESVKKVAVVIPKANATDSNTSSADNDSDSSFEESSKSKKKPPQKRKNHKGVSSNAGRSRKKDEPASASRKPKATPPSRTMVQDSAPSGGKVGAKNNRKRPAAPISKPRGKKSNSNRGGKKSGGSSSKKAKLSEDAMLSNIITPDGAEPVLGKNVHNPEEVCQARGDCKKPIDEFVDWVQCDDCDAWYHLACVGCEKNELDDDEIVFHCRLCQNDTKSSSDTASD